MEEEDPACCHTSAKSQKPLTAELFPSSFTGLPHSCLLQEALPDCSSCAFPEGKGGFGTIREEGEKQDRDQYQSSHPRAPTHTARGSGATDPHPKSLQPEVSWEQANTASALALRFLCQLCLLG